ncbi:MAG: energy transducer TonB [Candidatus Eisenbacteria bacterium]
MLLGACTIAALLLACGLLPRQLHVDVAPPPLIAGSQFLPEFLVAPATGRTPLPRLVAIDPHIEVRPVERPDEPQRVDPLAQAGPNVGSMVVERVQSGSAAVAPDGGGGGGGGGAEIQPGDFIYTDELPAVVTRVTPEYPPLAFAAGVEGTVVVWALVGLDGDVEEVRVQKSILMLDGAAREALQRWHFTPALVNKHAVRVWVAVPIRFRLHD